MKKGISPVISILLLILVAIVAGVSAYVWITKYVGESTMGSATSSLCLTCDAVQILPSGGVKLFIRNLGSTEVVIDKLYIYYTTPDKKEKIFDYDYLYKVGSMEVLEVTIPALDLSAINGTITSVKISSKQGTVFVVPKRIELLTRAKSTFIILKADRSWISPGEYFHWVGFNYNSGDYELYDNTTNVVQGPYSGRAPILKGIDEYTIATSWVPWNQRPIDSPIVIVVNPTQASQDWIFTWHDPHGTFRFYLQRLEGLVEIDFLVFWEDLFDPFHPPGSVDDWKDHVVRVTVFTNGTYRIAVFLAKGGYSHAFYLNATKPLCPINGELVYEKPYGAWWSYAVGGYYREIPDKIWLITP